MAVDAVGEGSEREVDWVVYDGECAGECAGGEFDAV